MVQFIETPRTPGLGELLGMGVSQGMQQQTQAQLQRQMEMEKAKQQMGMLGSVLGLGQAPQQQGAMGQPQQGETPAGQQGLGQPTQQQPQGLPYSQQQILAASVINPAVSNAMAHANQSHLAQQKLAFQEKKLQSSRELALQSKNEPEIVKINDEMQNLEQSASDFERLNTLYSESANKFPSSFKAAMLDLEGEGGLSKIGRSQLSPEAQESVKIIVNQLRGAKDTYGSRVTNFDAAKYLQGLPGLLNTPEGRKTIVRDLRIVNKINRLHNQGTLEAFKEAGGSGSIPLSEATSRGREKTKEQISQLRMMYVNPNRRDYKLPPDPEILDIGSIMEDEAGKQWKVSPDHKWELVGK